LVNIALVNAATVNTAAIRVGRLLEIRAVYCGSVADVALLFQTIDSELAKLRSSTQVVTVTDWRYCPVMSEEAAAHALRAMTQNGSRVLRGGALASQSSPIAALQLLRLMRESKHEARRLFHSKVALGQWLGEALTRVEAARLDEFLNEPVTVAHRRRRPSP
jgi:hypothetical protein